MAKSQEDGITILLGLKGYEVGKVSEDAEEIMVEVKVKPGGIKSKFRGPPQVTFSIHVVHPCTF